MKRFIESHKNETYDVIVIGGGITGAAVAYDAASRGLSVALLEKNDFGWATSAATSKLIHGGLRYLNNLEFGLVRESLRERRIMENIAPNFVYPIPFMMPNYNRFKNNKWILKIGMTLYDILAFDKKWTWDKSKRIPNHSALSRKKVIELEPNVKREGLTGASVYYDCQSIHPERLTLAFIKSAVKHGARVANYAKVENFLYDKGRVTGVKVRDLLKNATVEVRGALTVNCGGPWADIILHLAEKGKNNHHIRRSEGIHIITRPLVNNNAVALLTPGGRHFFIVPWRGFSLIGTTDHEYVGDPDAYHVTRERIEQFLGEINECFGDGKLSYDDVIFSYGGLRPLVDTQTEGTYKSSRKYEICDNALDGFDGLVTVEGGKYTTSRNLAVNVMKMAEARLNRRLPKSRTESSYLAGCEIRDMSAFLDEIVRTNQDFNATIVRCLGVHYGTEYEAVLDIARKKKELAEQLNDQGEIAAQVIYAVRHEMARTLDDILFRRTGIGTTGNPGQMVLKKVADIAARELQWDDARKRSEIAAAKKALAVPK